MYRNKYLEKYRGFKVIRFINEEAETISLEDLKEYFKNNNDL